MTSADFDPNSPQYGYPPAGSPQWSHAQPGGLGMRFFARLIDGILVNIVVFLLSIFLFDRDYWCLVTGLFSGVLMFGYFVLFEVSQQRHPGQEAARPGCPRPGRGAETGCEAVRHPQLVHVARRGALPRPAAGVRRLRRHRGDDQRQPHQAGQARRVGRRYPGRQELRYVKISRRCCRRSSPTSTAIPCSSGASGSKASNCDFTNAAGMKWPWPAGLPASDQFR